MALIPTRPAAAVSQASGLWRLPGKWSCLLSGCATFVTQEASPRQLKQGLFDVELPTDGLLYLTQGHTHLVWTHAGSSSRFNLTGPGVMRLTRQGGMKPLGPGLLEKGGRANGFELGFGPLVISSEGTAFAIVSTAVGATCLKVKEGIVIVRPGITPNSSHRITHGQGVCARPPDAHPLKASPPDAGLEFLEGPLLEEQFAALVTVERTSGQRGDVTPEDALATFAARLSQLEGEKLVQAAGAMVTRYQPDPVAPRALYLAWLKADGMGDATTATALAARLRTDFGSSFWTSLLGGFAP